VPVEIRIKKNETIIFDGLFVHAGTAGGPNAKGVWRPRYRMHRYIYCEDAPISGELYTYPLSDLRAGQPDQNSLFTKHFASKFVYGLPPRS